MSENEVLELKARVLDAVDGKVKVEQDLKTVRETLNSFASDVILICGLEFDNPDEITTTVVIDKLKEKFDYQEDPVIEVEEE